VAGTAEQMAKARAAKAAKRKPQPQQETALDRLNYARKMAGWPPLKETSK